MFCHSDKTAVMKGLNAIIPAFLSLVLSLLHCDTRESNLLSALVINAELLLYPVSALTTPSPLSLSHFIIYAHNKREGNEKEDRQTKRKRIIVQVKRREEYDSMLNNKYYPRMSPVSFACQPKYPNANFNRPACLYRICHFFLQPAP